MIDILNSKKAAQVRDGWLFGARMNRMGDPFEWIDGNALSHLAQVKGTLALLQYLAMSGEIYPPHDDLVVDNYADVLALIENKLRDCVSHFVPFSKDWQEKFDVYIRSTASVKAQDYSFIKRYAPSLSAPVHLDIGPGLGANAIYSLKALGSTYISLEASPYSYMVQRDFFRYLACEFPYLDMVDAESFGISTQELTKVLNASSNLRIRHLPSWNFDQLDNSCVDLASATWVLNEVNPAGIVWLLTQTMRVIKRGGYFYIRDSGLRKPLRHGLDYDRILQENGFELVKRLDIQNRIDMHGIPRIYKKCADVPLFFEAAFDRWVGFYAVTSHGGAMMQGTSTQN